MKIITWIDAISIRLEKFRPFLELIVLIAGSIGIKDKNMITKVGLLILALIVIGSIFSYFRIYLVKLNNVSFTRTFLNSEDWKQIKKGIDYSLLSLTGSRDKMKIRKAKLIDSAILYVLENKRNLSYNYVDELINDLIEDDNLTDFKE